MYACVCVCCGLRADGQVTLEVTAPDTITSWVASAFAVSSEVGLGVAEDTARVSVDMLLSPLPLYNAMMLTHRFPLCLYSCHM